MYKFQRIGIYGGGSFGTALAVKLARNPQVEIIKLLVKDSILAKEMHLKRRNVKYLPTHTLPDNVKVTVDVSDVSDLDLVIFAVPAHALIESIIAVLQHITPNQAILLATKGLHQNPTMFFSDKLKEYISNPLAILAGPNLAGEVAMDVLSSCTIASEDYNLAIDLADLLSSANFITSATDDIITIQIASAVKNIVAIKAGMLHAKGQGDNAIAYLISKGLKEIWVLSEMFGGKITTLAEPGVIGDLALTCYSHKSRNRGFGAEFSLSGCKSVDNYPELVEGVWAARALKDWIKKHKLKLPLLSTIIKDLGIM